MRKYIHTILCICSVLFFASCGSAEGEIKTEKTEVAQFTTDTEKVSEIATERVSGDIRQITVTAAPKVVRDLKKKHEEVTTEEVTEESAVSIDVNGYGWVELQYSVEYHIMDGHLTQSNGSIRVFGHRETWYSTNEGCGQATAVSIPGKHVADDGTIRDEDGYICVASSDLPFYSIVITSVGPGKVYDCGCSHGTIDVYTTW
jgi:hypothetical protein